MKKKTSKKNAQRVPTRGRGVQIDPVQFGIDLSVVLDEIKPHLSGTRREIGEAAGGLSPNAVTDLLNGTRQPSLGSLAALAHASGGQLDLKYKPPKPKKGKKT
ncbi:MULTISPECIES: helix-turn-helix domain-containing protein [Rhodopirellula]|jgi:transcriptional regulator with XRE-family HTH domain|uniref:helix-turn-helix domain-containing protein n=1 Tax=Rhodopirellula TaxID=265488 RepID=UPI0025808387|nr:helix-turn-helix transcriptional regulator [Rhodopirellula sp. UBA1907]